MKKILFIAFSAGLLLVSTAFTKIQNPENVPSGVFKIMEVTYLWELLQANYQQDYERDNTWIDSGLRAKYASARRYASLGMVEKAFGQKVFLSGPHGSDMNFTSTTSFGHYNPAFLNSLYNSVETILENPTFKKVAQYVYDDFLKGTMLSYGEAYDYWDQNPEKKEELKALYLKELANPNGTSNGSFLNHQHIRDFAQSNPDLDIFEAYSTPTFWIRRSIDGTEDDILKILQLIYDKLD